MSKTQATKVCNSCGVEKPSGDFHRRGENKSGHVLRSECIECERKRHKEEYQSRRAAMDPEGINPPGRPTRDTPYVRETINLELSAGKLLTEIIRENPDMPAYHTIMRWWLGQPGDGHDLFRSCFAQARQAQIEKWLEQAWTELQDPRDDWVWHEKRQEFVPDRFAPMRLKELLQHTRWMAERVLPTLYGSRVQVDHSHQSVTSNARIDWSKLDADTIRKVRAAMITDTTSGEQASLEHDPPAAGETLEHEKPRAEAHDSSS